MYYAPLIITSPVLLSAASMTVWTLYQLASGTYYLYNRVTNNRVEITEKQFNQLQQQNKRLQQRLAMLEDEINTLRHQRGDFSDYEIIND